MKKTIVAFFIMLSAACLLPISSWATPFINEIHYDNVGTDAGEAIEIAGPAGTDLTNWKLLLYNGFNGLLYNTTVLSGVLPNQQNGFGTLFFSYPVNGIQNGSPDGIALVDPLNAVIQFLSYEGTFIALDGSASGLISTDILVSESGTTPVGYSLQLLGAGTAYADFSWSGPFPASFGGINAGQNFVPIPGSLLLFSSGLGLFAFGLLRRNNK